jgi:Eukaryotic aspartyl protease
MDRTTLISLLFRTSFVAKRSSSLLYPKSPLDLLRGFAEEALAHRSRNSEVCLARALLKVSARAIEMRSTVLTTLAAIGGGILALLALAPVPITPVSAAFPALESEAGAFNWVSGELRNLQSWMMHVSMVTYDFLGYFGSQPASTTSRSHPRALSGNSKPPAGSIPIRKYHLEDGVIAGNCAFVFKPNLPWEALKRPSDAPASSGHQEPASPLTASDISLVLDSGSSNVWVMARALPSAFRKAVTEKLDKEFAPLITLTYGSGWLRGRSAIIDVQVGSAMLSGIDVLIVENEHLHLDLPYGISGILGLAFQALSVDGLLTPLLANVKDEGAKDAAAALFGPVKKITAFTMDMGGAPHDDHMDLTVTDPLERLMPSLLMGTTASPASTASGAKGNTAVADTNPDGYSYALSEANSYWRVRINEATLQAPPAAAATANAVNDTEAPTMAAPAVAGPALPSSSLCKDGCSMIVDTGTSFISMPPKAFEEFYRRMTAHGLDCAFPSRDWMSMVLGPLQEAWDAVKPKSRKPRYAGDDSSSNTATLRSKERVRVENGITYIDPPFIANQPPAGSTAALLAQAMEKSSTFLHCDCTGIEWPEDLTIVLDVEEVKSSAAPSTGKPLTITIKPQDYVRRQAGWTQEVCIPLVLPRKDPSYSFAAIDGAPLSLSAANQPSKSEAAAAKFFSGGDYGNYGESFGSDDFPSLSSDLLTALDDLARQRQQESVPRSAYPARALQYQPFDDNKEFILGWPFFASHKVHFDTSLPLEDHKLLPEWQRWGAFSRIGFVRTESPTFTPALLPLWLRRIIFFCIVFFEVLSFISILLSAYETVRDGVNGLIYYVRRRKMLASLVTSRRKIEITPREGNNKSIEGGSVTAASSTVSEKSLSELEVKVLMESLSDVKLDEEQKRIKKTPTAAKSNLPAFLRTPGKSFRALFSSAGGRDGASASKHSEDEGGVSPSRRQGVTSATPLQPQSASSVRVIGAISGTRNLLAAAAAAAAAAARSPSGIAIPQGALPSQSSHSFSSTQSHSPRVSRGSEGARSRGASFYLPPAL